MVRTKAVLSKYLKTKNRVKDVEPGDKIDVRDTEYVWCVGVVKLKIAYPSGPSSLHIHYEVFFY